MGSEGICNSDVVLMEEGELLSSAYSAAVRACSCSAGYAAAEFILKKM